MKIIVSILFSLAFCGSAMAESLARIEGVDDPALRAALRTAIGKRPPAETSTDGPLRRARAAADRAERLLRSEGYYRSIVEPRLDSDSFPTVQITVGPRVHIAAVDATTQPDTDARQIALDALALPLGTPLRAAAVIAADARGLTALQDAGWPSADSGDRSVRVDHSDDSAAIDFVYETGPYSIYGPTTLDSEGWRPDFIAGISPLHQGETASRSEILEYQRRLDALASVRTSQVMLADVDPATGERPLSITLTAAPRHSIEASLSYATSEGPGANIDWKRRNLFGGDETLTLEASAATLQQGVAATVTLPHWRRYQQTLTLNAGLQSQETDAFDQKELLLRAGITRHAGAFLLYGAGTRFDISQVTDANGPRDANTAQLELSLGYDSRNDPLDPVRGLNGVIEVSPAITFGDIEARYVRLETRASTYYRLADNLVAAARFRFGTVIGTNAQNLPADLRFFAGGGGSIRGFDYQAVSPIGSDGAPFGGLSVTEASLEMRWRSRGRWGVVAFIDSGAASIQSTPAFDELRTAIGIGARYYFDFAPLRIDFATPLDRRSDEAVLQFYVSLGQAF